MRVEAKEKEGSTISMKGTKQSSTIYVTNNVSHRGEGHFHIGGVMYCEEKACYDLYY